MRAPLIALGLAALSAPAFASPESRVSMALPEGLSLPPAPSVSAGVVVSPDVIIQEAVPLGALATPQVEQPVRVEIKGLLNRHWTAAEAIGDGPDKLYLSGQIDLAGNPYLAVLSPSWPTPRFFQIKRGMSGSWSLNGATYSVSLNVSIFRKKLNNLIEIEKGGAGKVYERRIGELFVSTNRAGQDVSIGGQTYRMFYSNNVDTGKDPMIASPGSYGFCFVHDAGSANDHDFKFYLIDRKDVLGAEPKAYKMFDDQILKFRVTADLSTLEISR